MRTVAVMGAPAERADVRRVASHWLGVAAVGAAVVDGAAVGLGVGVSGGEHTLSATRTDGTFTVRF